MTLKSKIFSFFYTSRRSSTVRKEGVPRLQDGPPPPPDYPKGETACEIIQEPEPKQPPSLTETITRIDRAILQLTSESGFLVLSKADYEAMGGKGVSFRFLDILVSPKLKQGEFDFLLPKDHVRMRVL